MEDFMPNRICVWIEDELMPINIASYRFVTGSVDRIGDEALIMVDKFVGRAQEPVKVMLLKSKGMVKDTEYLVDRANNEAYQYHLAEPDNYTVGNNA
jgi:hypothetical protein